MQCFAPYSSYNRFAQFKLRVKLERLKRGVKVKLFSQNRQARRAFKVHLIFCL